MSDTTDDPYRVRRYEPDDRPRIFDLYRSIFPEKFGESWFDWKYVENPYADDVPICVVERGDELVAARPSLPLRLSVAGEPISAVMQVDPMVAPEHRRNGLFSRMVRAVYDHYADRDPIVELGFPNEAVADALDDLAAELSLHAGVRVPFDKRFRVQRPRAFVSDEDVAAPVRIGAAIASPVARAGLTVRDAVRRTADEAIDVARHESVPATELASLAAETRPDRVHLFRDETFYRWRFENPRYEYETFVARRDGDPVAGVIAGTRRSSQTITHLTDALPVVPDPARETALTAAVGAAVEAAADSDLVVASPASISAPTLRRFGFLPTDRPPLSSLRTHSLLVARPLAAGSVAEGEWNHAGYSLSNADNWAFSLCERELG